MELYLDCAATTNIDLDVLEKYKNLLSNYFASTGSLHLKGEETYALESDAKNEIAKLLKVKPNEIYFNSGATEGNNYAIKGIALNYKNRGNVLITSKIEHPSVLTCFEQLKQDYGFECIYLDVDENGLIDLNQLESVLNNQVILVSIMYVNHEVGSILQIKKISEMLRKYPKIIFHSDITQALGKTSVDLSLVDIATMSAHKIHGIKGSGFLYKRNGIEFYPIISGIPLLNSLRAGTSNWPSNVVLSLALKKSLCNLKTQYLLLKETQEKLILKLKEMPQVIINTNVQYSIPGIINFSLLDYNVEVIVRALSLKGIYVSSKSVCSTKNKDLYSSVLLAMNKDKKVCASSIRVSFNTPLSDEQIDYFINSLKEILVKTKK